MGTVAFLLALGMLATSAGWLAACLRLRSPAAYLLAAYLIAWAEVVFLCLALSLPRILTRGSLLGGLAVLVLSAWLVRRRLGRPAVPLARTHLNWLLDQLRDPVLGVLAVGVALGYAYAAALAFLTPQNDGDPLVYQLTRAALWRQEHGVGIVGADFEVRLDANPIVAEVGQLATMVAAGSARYVAVGQLAGVVALTLGAYGLGRRIGLGPRGALLGALVVPTLPVIALQSWTAGNDVVVGSFIVAAAVFVLGHSRAELALAGAATALAVGTKFTGPLLLPVLVLLALMGARAGGRVRAVAALVAGAAVGSGWYVVNIVRTGDLDGGLGESSGQGAAFGVGNAAKNASLLLLDAVDASGAIETYEWAYVLAAALLAAALLGARAAPIAFLGPLLVALVPFAAQTLGGLLADALGWLWDLRGEAATAEELRDWELSTAANAYISWYGPVALILGAVMLVVTILASRRGAVSRAAVALALAPIVSLVVISAALDYDLSWGRFFVAPVVAGCAVLGLVARVRWLAGALAVTSVVTLALVLVNAMPKPSGIQAGEYAFSPAIWRLERWQAQMLLRPVPSDPGEAASVQYVEQHVPEAAAIALALRSNDFLFPYFGPALRRKVDLLDPADRAPADAEWLLAAPERAPLACPDSWRLAHTSGEWRVWARTAPDRCERAEPI